MNRSWDVLQLGRHSDIEPEFVRDGGYRLVQLFRKKWLGPAYGVSFHEMTIEFSRPGVW
jgi:hypothetical protein